MRKLIYIGIVIAVCWFAADCARAAELHLPQNAVAGQPLSIGTSGSGTLYLIGPGQVIKRDFKSGGNVEIKGEELRSAGRWIAIVRSGGSSQSSVFWVKPGPAENLSFLARPSRVPESFQGRSRSRSKASCGTRVSQDRPRLGRTTGRHRPFRLALPDGFPLPNH